MMKILKNVYLRIRDWKSQIIEMFLLLFVLLTPFLVDISSLINKVLISSNVQPSEIEWEFRIIFNLERFIFSLIFFAVLLWFLRHKINKKIVITQSIPNTIVWHSIIGYWFCSKVLNYRSINLRLVPIPIQFRLICKKIFKDYKCMEGIEEKDSEPNIKYNIVDNCPFSSTVNLVLSDTYKINIDVQLPEEVRHLTTIEIDRSSTDKVRYHSRDFISKVVSEIRSFPLNVKEVNLFCTLNPANCYDVATEAFCTGGRDSIQHLNVYQQNSNGERIFDTSYKIF